MAEQKKPEDKPKEIPKPSAAAAQALPQEVTKQLDEIMRRLKLIEERYSGARKKSQFTEQNMLKDTKEIFEDMSLLNNTVSELKGEISELNEKLSKLTEEVKSSAKKDELNVLSKYLDFWQPLEFLSRAEAERMIRDMKH